MTSAKATATAAAGAVLAFTVMVHFKFWFVAADYALVLWTAYRYCRKRWPEGTAAFLVGMAEGLFSRRRW